MTGRLDPRRVFVKTPATFVVEELLPFAPSGEGEHLYLRIRMRGQSTAFLLKNLRKAIPVGALGYAGLKDRDATVIQHISVHRAFFPTAQQILENLGVEILSCHPHRHKLRPGKVMANRFRLRGVHLTPGEVMALQMEGFPNRYGLQRFVGDNLHQARELVDRLLRGEKWKQTWESRFLLSVFQAACFNEMLEMRIRRGWLRTVLPGDRVMDGGWTRVWDGGSVPLRPDRMPTHLLPGRKVPLADRAPGELEQEVLETMGLTAKDLQRLPVRGTRRAVVAFPGGVIPTPEGLEVILPSGAYATVMLEHLGFQVLTSGPDLTTPSATPTAP